MPPFSWMYSATARLLRGSKSTWLLGWWQQLAGDEGRREVAADGPAGLVDEGGAIGVAVECDAEIGAVLAYRGLRVVEALELEQVGLGTTPHLIQHGDRDPRVPVAGAWKMYRALEPPLGKPVELYVYPRGAHVVY